MIARKREQADDGVAAAIRAELETARAALARAEAMVGEMPERPVDADAGAPRLDPGRLAVVYDGRQLVVGPGVGWALLEVLVSRPGWFFELRDTVWVGQTVSDEGIRAALWRLRQQLRAGGMADLAAAISSGPRGCSLAPVWRVKRNETETKR